VLIVDDDEMARFVLTEKLTESGFGTVAVGDGLSALETYAGQGPFDAVLLDLKMPGMDGIETLRELLKRDPEVPVIMVTAFGDVATAVEAIKLGAYDFVEKPPQVSRIGLTLRRAIEKAALEREVRALAKSAAESSMLKAANDKLLELDRIKTAFLSSISHELRTPLTSIIGFGELNRNKLAKLAPRLEDPKAAREVSQAVENLEILVGEARRLTELVDNVLELTAIEAGAVAWQWEPLPLGELIAAVVGGQRPLFAEKGLELASEVGALPLVRGDREKLSRVLSHLLGNALKFTERGRITLRAQAVGNGVRVEVSDPGCGIPEALHRVIFDKFRQLGDTLTDKPKGVGLGLPLCRLIVECHGGTLRVESQPGTGSVFSVLLPAAEEVGP
jgi:signal transduction histidine kinase